jgi:hypothetical protein
MTFAFDEFAAAVRAGAPITDRDTLALRQWSWNDGRVNKAEAEALFDLNNIGKSRAPEWVDCFVEAISEFVINSTEPKGYISDDNAKWLMAQIDKDGRLDSLGELELLAKILEKANSAPESLKTYALKQIETTVLTGAGPTRVGEILRPGSIDPIEVHLLRRIVFAQAGDGPACVSEAEADLLFRIKDATLDAENAPGWQKLFVQAVGNHLMAHSSYTPLAREDAARLEAFMNDTQSSVGGFLSRMSTGGFVENFKSLFGSKAEQSAEDHDAEVAAANAVTSIENAWLKAKLDADHTLDPLEKALLAFIAEETGTAPS